MHKITDKNTAYSDELGLVLSNLYVTPNKEHEASYAYASYGYYLAIYEEWTQALKDLEGK